METLYTTDKGTEFIGKINNNFTELSGTTDVPVTISVPMQGGPLSTTDGHPIGSITDTSIYLNSVHSINYIRLSTVESISASSGTARIHCFGEDYSYLGLASGTTLQSGTKMVRVEVNNSSAFTSFPTVTMSITKFGGYAKEEHTKLTAKFFCFETFIPYLNPGADSSYYGHTGRYFDQGFIKLPPNYSPNGTPVQVVFYCHGSSGYEWGESSVLLYDSLLEFICKCGFAVVDCSGLTSYWMDGDNNPYASDSNCKKNSKWQPTSYSAYCNLYDYIINNYNVSTDGVYIFGKSAGGMGANLLASSQPFPIRAAGGLAPTMSLNCADMRHGYVSNKVLKQWLLMFGVANYDQIVSQNGAEIQVGSNDLDILLAGVPNFIGYDALTANSDIDLETLTQAMYSVSISAYGTTPAIQAIFASGHKEQSCPYKIWLAQDDSVIPWSIAQYYKEIVKAGNCVFELRQMPSGTGGHHSVDTDANAPKCDYVTPYGGTVNIPVAYAELVDWFNRW